MVHPARRLNYGQWATVSHWSHAFAAFALLAGMLLLQLGCAHDRPIDPAASIAPFQQYIAPNAEWSSIQRVVLMPLANQTAYPRVADELQTNLAAELQRAGRFDIVVATHEDPGVRARDIFARGQFDEVELLRVAREYQAQAVLFGKVTQYHPYNPPRIGLSLVMINPAEGVAIASSDGLWDARETGIAAQAKQLYGQSLAWPQSVLGTDRVLESPDVFQRFVSQQVASSLIPPAAPVNVLPAAESQNFVMPVSAESASPVPPATPPSTPQSPNNP